MKKAIVLAAGKGTRMKSNEFKVMHTIGGRPMILRLLDTLGQVGISDVAVVLAPDMGALHPLVAPAKVAIQEKPLGTGHAVLSAEKQIGAFDGQCLILFGDQPMYYPSTLQKMLDKCEAGADVVVLGFEPKDPSRYGRLILGEKGLDAIVEYKDATDEQRAIGLCNSGAMCVNGRYLFDLLKKVGSKNAAGEYYLTDIVEIAKSQGLKVDVEHAVDEFEAAGVNSRDQLAFVEEIFQVRMRQAAFEAGVTMIDPKTVYFSYDTTFENDIIIEPCVFFGSGVHLEKGAYVKAFSRIENQVVRRK